MDAMSLRDAELIAGSNEPDYEAMTLEDLQREMVILAQLLVPIQNRRNRVIRMMERRKHEAAARARVGAMSEQQKDALRSVLDKP